MMNHRRRIRSGTLLGVLLLAACGDSDPDPFTPEPEPTLPPRVTIQFSVVPLPAEAITSISRLGNLNPPGHTFPSDHIGLSALRPESDPSNEPFPVFAPADGYVVQLWPSDVDDGLAISPQHPDERGADRTWYYMGHFFLDPGIQIGTHITAGQRIGETRPRGGGIDLGIMDDTITNAFVHPERYGPKMAHGLSPLSRFSAAHQALLLPLTEGEGPKVDGGKFVYDIPGKLEGNWFHESLPYDQSAETSPDSWSRHLSFVEDPQRPGDQLLVHGGYVTGEGQIFPVHPADPDFATVDVSSGKVLFRSRLGTIHWWLDNPYNTNKPNRIFMVEMTGPETLRIEMFVDSVPPTAFTSAAQVYKR